MAKEKLYRLRKSKDEEDTESGPYSMEQLQDMWLKNDIDNQCYICRDDLKNPTWLPITDPDYHFAELDGKQLIDLNSENDPHHVNAYAVGYDPRFNISTISIHSSKNEKSLAAAYIFLSSDKQISGAEKEIFESISSEYKTFNNMKKSFRTYYADILEGAENRPVTAYTQIAGIGEAPEQYETLWRMAQIVYYYGLCSDAKLQIVASLLKNWKIDSSVFYEMKDAAQTLRAIEAHRKLLSSLPDQGDDTQQRLEEAAKSWEDTVTSINTLINLG